MRTAAELQAERDFLLLRLVGSSADWVGISSNAMLCAAITGDRVSGSDFPRDKGDLGRCEETYRRAPDHLKPAIAPILAGFRLLVAERPWRGRDYTYAEAAEWIEDAIRRASPTPSEVEG